MPTKKEIAVGLAGRTDWHLEGSLSQIVTQLITSCGDQWGDKGQTGVAERIYSIQQTRLILDVIERSLETKKNMWVTAGVTAAKIEGYRNSLD